MFSKIVFSVYLNGYTKCLKKCHVFFSLRLWSPDFIEIFFEKHSDVSWAEIKAKQIRVQNAMLIDF